MCDGERAWKYHNHRKLIFDRVKKLKPESILEVGCNTCGNLEWIRDYFPEVKKYGCDNNDAYIQANKNLFPEFEFQTGSILGLPYKDKSIDVLTVDMVLYLIDDIDTAIKECKRVAKKAVIISEKDKRCEKYIVDSNDFEEVIWDGGNPDVKSDDRFVFTLLV